MDATTIDERLRRLVDEYRDRCLWFLRADYYPTGLDEQLRVLDLIERNGDVAALRKAREAREWLSPTSNEPSAG